MFNLGAAMSLVWSSPSFPQLLAPGGPVQITVQQGTWILSAMKVGQFIMPIPAAWMMQRLNFHNSLCQ